MFTVRSRWGFFTTALAAATSFCIHQNAYAQTFTIELITPPAPMEGAKIKDISDNRSLLVQRLNNRDQVIEDFFYGFSTMTNTYAAPGTLFFSSLDPGGLDRRASFIVGNITSRATALNLTNNRTVPLHPANYNSSSLTAADNGTSVGWAQPAGGRRHGVVWVGFPGLNSDQHPFIAQALGGEWISSELRGVRAVSTEDFQTVGFGQRRDIPGNHAIARTNSWVELHPSSFAESEALTLFGGFQAGWGRDSMGLEHALVWQGTAASAISLNPSGYGNSRCLDMDSEGIAGYSKLGSVDHALFWKRVPTNPNGFAPIDLHQFLPVGSGNSVAVGITSGGVVAGHFQTNNVWRPVLWHPIHLTSLAFSGTRILGGVTTSATVRISRPAPTGGVTIAVSPANGVYLSTRVASVTIPAGQTQTTFPVYSRPVSGPTSASISATLGQERLTASILLDTLRFVR